MLLESAGLPVETEAPGVDERAVEAAAREDALDPSALASRLAAEKALAVSRRRPGRVVVGADQVLDLDGKVLHKPADRSEARDHLLGLSGRTHMLRSAGALALDGEILEHFLDSAALTVRHLGPDGIERYLDFAGPDALSSVGCYQVEGRGIHLFDRIAGEHSTILGLPLRPLLAALRRRQWLAF
jgi:septum formation protein